MKPQWKEAYVRLYKSVKVDAKGTVTKVGGQKGSGPIKGSTPATAPIRQEGYQVDSGGSVIPPGYNVEEALDTLEVPPGQEDTVKQYFDAISGQ